MTVRAWSFSSDFAIQVYSTVGTNILAQASLFSRIKYISLIFELLLMYKIISLWF